MPNTRQSGSSRPVSGKPSAVTTYQTALSGTNNNLDGAIVDANVRNILKYIESAASGDYSLANYKSLQAHEAKVLAWLHGTDGRAEVARFVAHLRRVEACTNFVEGVDYFDLSAFNV